MSASRHILPWLLACLLAAGCATSPRPVSGPGIGPWHTISGRLLVIEPARRWQVMLDWQADGPLSGHARLVHAASGTVVELRWQGNDIRLRDNRSPTWRRVSPADLAKHGIVVSPLTLSRILEGHIPPSFHAKGTNVWEDSNGKQRLRLAWNPASRRLQISDLRHGRQATLIILKTDNSDPVERAP